MRAGGPRPWVLGVAVLAAVRSAAAAAPPTAVAVIQPAGDDPILTEAASRLGAELSAAGMRTSAVACVARFDPQCPAPADLGDAPDAAVTILRAGGEAAIEVRVTTDGSRSVLVRRMEISPEHGGDDPSVLAIRAVELLRATLMQRTAEARSPPESSPPEKVTDVEQRPAAAVARPSRSWGIAAGPALLQSLHGFGGAYGPELGVALRPYPWLGFEAKLAALAFASDLTAQVGSASLQQQLGDLNATYALPLGGRLLAIVSAGAGAYHIGVTGHATAPEQHVTSALWAPEIDVGLGLVVRLGAAYALRFDAAAIFVYPSPYVMIGTDDSFHAGRPLLLFGVTLERGVPDVWGRH